MFGRQTLSLLFLTSLTYSTAVSATSSRGCGSTFVNGLTRGGQASSNALNITTSAGLVRTYLLHIPTSYNINTPAPLVFNFHGRSSTGAAQESLSGMSNEAWNPKYLVVYPDGIRQEWQGDPDAVGFDDVSFALQLVDTLSSQFCIDQSRIYASGLSNGGGFSANILACHPIASTIFAGFAGASSADYQGNTDVGCDGWTISTNSCNPGRWPIPLITTHGTSDGTINYYGGGRRGRCLPAIPKFMTDWSARTNLSTTNTSTSLYNGASTKYEWGSGSLQGVLTHYMLPNWDHYWPSTAGGAPFDGTPTILSFFDKWTLDTTPYNWRNTTTIPTTSTTTSSVANVLAASVNTPVVTTLTCPSADGVTFNTTLNSSFIIECNVDRAGGDMGMVSAISLDACINACAAQTNCVDVSFVGSACYQKSSIRNPISNGGVWGARKIITSSLVSSTLPTVASSSLPVSSTPVSFTSVSFTSVSSTPVSFTSVSFTSVSSTPVSFTSVSSTLVSSSSVSSSSVSSTLVSSASVSSSSVSSTLVSSSSVSSSSVSSSSVSSSSVSSSSVSSLSVSSLSVSSLSVSSTSVSSTSVSISSTTLPTSTLLTSPNGIPPSGTSSSGNNYQFYAYSDSSQNSFNRSQAATSFIDCMDVCDKTSTCTAFTYVGVAFGAGPGICWLKSVMGNAVPVPGSNFISGRRIASASATTVGNDGLTSVAYPPTCTAINTNTYAVTDTNNIAYLFMCGGGSTGTAYSIVSVANSWRDCFSQCDFDASCNGFSYVNGPINGEGGGQCWLKNASPMSFTSTLSLMATRIAAYRRDRLTTTTTVSIAGTSTRSISSSFTSAAAQAVYSLSSFIDSSSSSISIASLLTSTSSLPSTSSLSSTSSLLSTTIGSTTIVSISSSSSTMPLLSISTTSAAASTTSSSDSTYTCPASNGTTITDSSTGYNYTISCVRDTIANTIESVTSQTTINACIAVCAKNTLCSGISWDNTLGSCSLRGFGGWIANAVRN